MKEKKLGDRLSLAAVYFSAFNCVGMVVKAAARSGIDFNGLETHCRKSISDRTVCHLLSTDSAPDAIQAFSAAFGTVLAVHVLFPQESARHPRKTIVISALLLFGLIIFAEVWDSAIQYHNAFNIADVITETAGMVPPMTVLWLLAGKDKPKPE